MLFCTQSTLLPFVDLPRILKADVVFVVAAPVAEPPVT
jgi:hypothetical protein